MRVTAREKALAAKTDWLEWSIREQGWLLRAWDHGMNREGERSMMVLLTEEQRQVVFAGLDTMKIVKVLVESLGGEKGVANGD